MIRFKLIFVLLMILISDYCYATDITWDDFTSGKLVTLSNLNEIKSAVNSKLDKYSAAVAFSISDATPDISGTSDTFRPIFKTADTTVYTDFDDGTDHTTINDGQLLIILAQHAAGLDCTSSQINCNGGSDYTFTVGDVAICYFDDTADGDGQWLCSVSNPVGTGFVESGDYSPTGTWDWSGVNGATIWPTFNQNTTGTAAGITGDLDPDQLTGDATNNDKVDGGIVSPSAATGVVVNDSGDGNPATGTVLGFYSGVGRQSYVVTCNDTDGCTMTMSETGALANMVILVINSESSTGSLTFSTSSGVQSVRSARTLDTGESITFIYRDDYWDEIGESTNSDYSPLSSVPGSPVTGKVYVADSDNWNPCSSDAITDYLVMYNGAVYLPLWNVDGTPIVQTAAPGTPKTGWYYWADANGTWDPDTEITGTDPYKVYYNGSGYISVQKQDGTILSSTQQTKCTTIAGVTADSDYMVEQLPYAITIRSARVTQRGATNVIGHFDECDSAGASCAGIDGATDITATTTATDDGSLSNGTIDANDVIQWHTTSVSGTNTDTIVCINYTLDN